jgi:hypothetical protein
MSKPNCVRYHSKAFDARPLVRPALPYMLRDFDCRRFALHVFRFHECWLAVVKQGLLYVAAHLVLFFRVCVFPHHVKRMLEEVVHRLDGSALQMVRSAHYKLRNEDVRLPTFVSGIHNQMKPTPAYVRTAYIKKTPHPMSVIMWGVARVMP